MRAVSFLLKVLTREGDILNFVDNIKILYKSYTYYKAMINNHSFCNVISTTIIIKLTV